MATGVVTDPALSFVPVPLTGLAGRQPVAFPIYLRTAADTWVLYRDKNSHIGEDQIERLASEGLRELFIRPADRGAYLHRVEGALNEILADRRTPVERRVDVLHGVATSVASEVLVGKLDGDGIARSQRLLVNASGLVLRDQTAFPALRSMLGASRSLAQHSVTVAFLAMGLARHVLSPDPTTLVHAGLGGMFHDIGRIGHEDLDHDPEHTHRGAAMLKQFGMPKEVAEVALAHHERWDGSGFPRMLSGEAIAPLARVVGIVDVFDEVYSSQKTPVGVFDALRILAQAYRGCFEERVAMNFVRLFR
ncbi:MAG: HD-GYP domain-containing protein [Planctomycetota bacterium]